jgi:hypothetical protein
MTDPRAPQSEAPDAPPPLFGRWGVLYALVALELVLVILLCGWLAGRHA